MRFLIIVAFAAVFINPTHASTSAANKQNVQLSVKTKQMAVLGSINCLEIKVWNSKQKKFEVRSIYRAKKWLKECVISFTTYPGYVEYITAWEAYRQRKTGYYHAISLEKVRIPLNGGGAISYNHDFAFIKGKRYATQATPIYFGQDTKGKTVAKSYRMARSGPLSKSDITSFRKIYRRALKDTLRVYRSRNGTKAKKHREATFK